MTPDKRGHKPQYGSSEYQKGDRHNKLLHLLGGTGQIPDWDKVQKGAGIVLHQVCHLAIGYLLCVCVYMTVPEDVMHCDSDIGGGCCQAAWASIGQLCTLSHADWPSLCNNAVC